MLSLYVGNAMAAIFDLGRLISSTYLKFSIAVTRTNGPL